MRKFLAAVAAAVTLIVAAVAAPTTADARRAWRGGPLPYYYAGYYPGYYYLYPINQAFFRPVPVYYGYFTPGPYYGCWRYGVFVC